MDDCKSWLGQSHRRNTRYVYELLWFCLLEAVVILSIELALNKVEICFKVLKAQLKNMTEGRKKKSWGVSVRIWHTHRYQKLLIITTHYINKSINWAPRCRRIWMSACHVCLKGRFVVTQSRCQDVHWNTGSLNFPRCFCFHCNYFCICFIIIPM